MRYHLLAGLLVSALAGAAVAAPPAKFLNDAARGDTSETELGKLIAKQGATDKTREYGNLLASDHGSHRDKVDALAKQLGVKVSHTMEPEARAEMTKLQRLHGRPFDAEVRRYMINDHQKDIATYSAQVRSGEPKTAKFARETLPVLRHHLEVARSLGR